MRMATTSRILAHFATSSSSNSNTRTAMSEKDSAGWLMQILSVLKKREKNSTRSDDEGELGWLSSELSKYGMILFIASMCIALPVTLFPIFLLERFCLISRIRRERWSLEVGQLCSRWLMRLIPFMKIDVVEGCHDENPEPTVWVCNHTSMLDIFVLLAADRRLRGRMKRPIKIVYWKGLESNPITRILFRMCGFISVQMAANASGVTNDYDKSSFKTLLKEIKRAFIEGFDIGLLPEGQLNPHPESGLVTPLYSGAFTLARMSRRPIRMMGLYGVHRFWHADERIGMDGRKKREVKVKVYPPFIGVDGKERRLESGDEFCETFMRVVGEFGASGEDLEELGGWMDGSAWKELKKKS